ncbi:nucleotide sugar dehydrogenase [Jeotgalibacillus sp. S-D1]|uniref:nucleotide sugar dehydrogenase n=1 Tax=Jeotgalibacillus sp. S-D1 TaxID=2552189 RepID=UPI001059E684|nr:nucleotide sugar dehydrogenase [Jeotgalibacillus sp. S-D1]TDL30590.1 nucleotide sugar dehydrogenase [Jeotgalibacillus sp. S-D1]
MSLKNKSKDEHVHTNNEEKIVIGMVGLGYVGLPVALGFSKKYSVIGYDVSPKRVQTLSNFEDYTGEVTGEQLKNSGIVFTTDEKKLNQCSFIIVAVPTPISTSKEPDLTYLKNASAVIGKNLSKDAVVVYESTVYPGATEEVCIPILEAHSGLQAGKDFFVGYSPERINPGDKEHTFEVVNKVVSAQDEKTLEKVYQLYQSVITAQVVKASTIKVAEASKILENTQRDINIALMNEVSLIFNKLGIDTFAAIEAASSKWNFIPFHPGLVGGHCIGVDPYYLIHKSKAAGYIPHFLSAAREINDFMPEYIVTSLLKEAVLQKKNPNDLVITVMGVTFKPDIPDIRNSKAIEIIEELQNLGLKVQVCDPHVKKEQFASEALIDLKKLDQLEKADVLLIAVPHSAFITLPVNIFKDLLKDRKGIIMDIKGLLSSSELGDDIVLWKL